MPSEHAKLSCSSAHRWMHCPGSVKLAEGFPNTSSIYADEGTLAHSYAEKAIGGGRVGKELKDKIKAFYAEHEELDGSLEYMQKTLEPYMDYCQEEYLSELANDPATKIMKEEKVDLTGYIPGGFGTTDVAIVRSGYIHIIDLKYGKGVQVSADHNPQIMLYALGMLEAYDMIYDFEDVVMTIYQPRLDNVSTFKMKAADLYKWGKDEVIPAAEESLTDDAPFNAGDWCQFCPARRFCRERADYNMEVMNYKIKAMLTDKEVGEVLGKIDSLIRWANDLKDGALNKILTGGDIPGWKAVEGRSVRKFTGSEDEIVKAAGAAGYKKPLLFETKMITLSAMEKLMGKKAFADAVGQYVEKPEGKPTLAPESDERPSINSSSAAEAFAGEFDN